MKYFSEDRRLRSIFLLLIIALFAMCWLIESTLVSTSLLEPVFFNQSGGIIKSIDAEFINKSIYLNVHLKKYISCEEVMKLGIQSFEVKNNTYKITGCSHVSDSFIKIVYTRTTMT